ncbi:MAG TPA: class I SAM-dependent methyltransferase [Blastocatellia bacterium]|nr:class I SAM-dependent methyltransferase [Blastocatellia bacterium]
MHPTQHERSSATESSFRDPAGRLIDTGDRVIRTVNASFRADLEAFLSSKTCKKLTEKGSIARTTLLSPEEVDALRENEFLKEAIDVSTGGIVVEHERIPFKSFPYEWPPEMLYEAGSLTLDIAESLLKEGMGLKDATPYNVLFRGPAPVFVDLLSFERRDASDPIWLPAAQFERTFLLPLFVAKRFGLQLSQLLSTRRDGLEPEDVYKLCGPLAKLSPGLLSFVTIPTLLGRRTAKDETSLYEKRTSSNPEKARFILDLLFKRLRRALRRAKPEEGKVSVWSDYMVSNNNYSDVQIRRKEELVEAALNDFAPRTLLDVGCNTGHFSIVAARRGASVVAIDYDPVVVGSVWRQTRREGLDVLPLVVDLSRPSPGIGWLNRECPSFLERAGGGFDAVLMLAIIHHLLVTERIPLAEILGLVAHLTRRLAVIEFISPEDSMFRRLARGRDHLFEGLTKGSFETACQSHFEIVRSERIEQSSRWLYVLRKR